MALLPVDHVTVSGTFNTALGAPRVGYVKATASTDFVLADPDIIVPQRAVIFPIVAGTFSGDLPATDDVRLGVTGWTWEIRVIFTDAFNESEVWHLALPAALGSIDLADVTSASPSAGRALAPVLVDGGGGSAGVGLSMASFEVPIFGSHLRFSDADGTPWTLTTTSAPGVATPGIEWASPSLSDRSRAYYSGGYDSPPALAVDIDALAGAAPVLSFDIHAAETGSYRFHMYATNFSEIHVTDDGIVEATAVASPAPTEFLQFVVWSAEGLTLEAGWNTVAIRVIGTVGQDEAYSSFIGRIALSKIA